MLEKKNYLGVGITTTTEKNILKYVVNFVKSKQKFYIVTPNPELIVLASKNKEYSNCLNQARISLPDGIGIVLASHILGKKLEKRITGVDFMLELCMVAAENGLSIGLLGGGSGVAEKTADCLLQSYPNLNIVYFGEEWRGNSKHKTQSSKFIDILFVAFGSPKQEKWIAENLEKLPVYAAMGVGGAFDFISGSVPRAPAAIRKIGLEWAYRLIRQPWRWRRQLRLVKFAGLVLKEKLQSLRSFKSF